MQQDDVLIATMTVREQFEFALKITTNLSENECNEKVDALIDRLGLQSC